MSKPLEIKTRLLVLDINTNVSGTSKSVQRKIARMRKVELEWSIQFAWPGE